MFDGLPWIRISSSLYLCFSISFHSQHLKQNKDQLILCVHETRTMLNFNWTCWYILRYVLKCQNLKNILAACKIHSALKHTEIGKSYLLQIGSYLTIFQKKLKDSECTFLKGTCRKFKWNILLLYIWFFFFTNIWRVFEDIWVLLKHIMNIYSIIHI